MAAVDLSPEVVSFDSWSMHLRCYQFVFENFVMSRSRSILPLHLSFLIR